MAIGVEQAMKSTIKMHNIYLFGNGSGILATASDANTKVTIPFANNDKAWSGDHCIHPDLVPGVLFTSIVLDQEKPARIVDIAPTTLELLGVDRPAYMDGHSLL